MKPIRDTDILKRFSKPPRNPPDDPEAGSISTFPSSPLDMPTATFERDMKRREENHCKLIQWIKLNLRPDVDYGRTHIDARCRYARAGITHLCRNFSHFSNLTLWKSGAEQLIHVLGLSAHFPNLHQYELSAVHRQDITQVVLKCELRTVNGKVVAEGAGARHIKQDDWNLNASIKMASKSAMIDATIRVAGLTGIFIKTHRHTVKNNLRRGTECNTDNLPSGGLCNRVLSDPKAITPRQKDYITRLSGIKGHTTEGLKRLIQEQFNKSLDNLNRVEAHHLIQQING